LAEALGQLISRLGSESKDYVSHKPGSRLPIEYFLPGLPTFQANIKLYCLVIEAHLCEQFGQDYNLAVNFSEGWKVAQGQTIPILMTTRFRIGISKITF